MYSMNTSKGILIATFLLLALPFTYIAVRGTNIIPSRAQTNATSTPTKSPTPTITGTISPTVTLTPTPTIVCKNPSKTAQYINACDVAKKTFRTVYYSCNDDSNGYYNAKGCLSQEQLKNLADTICTSVIKPVCNPLTPTITGGVTPRLTNSITPRQSNITPITNIVDLQRMQQTTNPGTGQLTCTPETLSLGTSQTGKATVNATWKDIIPDYPAVDICMQTDGGTASVVNSSQVASGSLTKEVQNLSAGHTYTFQLHNQRAVLQHCTGRVLSSCQVVVKQ